MNRDLQVTLRKFGARMRQLREAHGISQDELGERCGVSQKFISQVERGANTPSFETIVAIAHRGFGIAAAELMRGIDPHPSTTTSELDHLLAAATPKVRDAVLRVVKVLVDTLR